MASAPDLFSAAPQMVIRQMRALDVADVVAIEHAAYQFPWSEGIFRDCLRVGYVCRVVTVAQVLMGYGVMSTGAGEAHILNLCVGESFRCQGLGRALMLELIDRAATAGVREAFLEVRPSNTAAIRLYQSMGFVHLGMRRGYYQAAMGREDAAVLRLAIGTGTRVPGAAPATQP